MSYIKRKKTQKRKKKILAAVIILFISGLITFYLYKLSVEIQYPLPHYDIVTKYSLKYNVEAPLIYAIIKAESNFVPDARSSKGAIGLMQVTPDTGKWISEKLKVSDFDEYQLLNPETNIEYGVWYINWLKSLEVLNNGENTDVIIAAYNGGNGRVAQWLKNKEYSSDGKKLDHIPYDETANYVIRVNKYIEIYDKKLNKL